MPTVYIEREPLLAMVLAAEETGHKECYGTLFGSKPSRSRDYYHVSFVQPRQCIVRRTNAEVRESTSAGERMQKFLAVVGNLYPPIIGDFHSHPAYQGKRRPLRLSEADIKDMRSKDGKRRPLGIVITLAPRGKRPAPWRRLNKKTRLRGTLGNFTFDLMAFHLVGDGPDAVTEALVIEIAPSTRKALQRACKR